MFSVWNTHHIALVTDSISAELTLSAERAESGDVASAEAHARRAKDIWDSHRVYFESVLRHTEFDTVCEDFYNVEEKLLDGDEAKVALYANHAVEHLRAVADMERVRIGTIF